LIATNAQAPARRLTAPVLVARERRSRVIA
jgi:hypothetical protein